jgi:hypothetical protein
VLTLRASRRLTDSSGPEVLETASSPGAPPPPAERQRIDVKVSGS